MDGSIPDGRGDAFPERAGLRGAGDTRRFLVPAFEEFSASESARLKALDFAQRMPVGALFRHSGEGGPKTVGV
jgi:hypothetical protein